MQHLDMVRYVDLVMMAVRAIDAYATHRDDQHLVAQLTDGVLAVVRETLGADPSALDLEGVRQGLTQIIAAVEPLFDLPSDCH